MALAIYLHTPFCVTQCPYCDFYSGVFDEALIAPFIGAVRREIEMRAPALTALGPVTSVFVGGGTPSFLGAPALLELCGSVERQLACTADCEWTVECNPESLTPQLAAELGAFGVNRLSIGVQSLTDQVLRTLERPHDAKVAWRALECAVGWFERVNADFIIAVPGMTPDALRSDLEQVLALGVGHLSAYGLTVEVGTVLAERQASGQFAPLDDNACLAQDQLVAETAAAFGLERYEVSNYARPDQACRHNLDIWQGGFYAGFGPGAHSYLPVAGGGSERSANRRDLRRYVGALARGEAPPGNREWLNERQRLEERLLQGMRLTAGVDLKQLESEFGAQPIAPPVLAALEGGGFLEVTPSHVRTTARGRWVLDSVVGALVGGL